MGARQKCEERVFLVVEHVTEHGDDSGQGTADHRVGDDDALWVSGRARGIHDTGRILCLRPPIRRDIRLSFAQLPQLVDGFHDDTLAIIVRLSSGNNLVDDPFGGLAIINDDADGGSVSDHFGDRVEKLCIREHADAAWLVEGVREAILAKAVVSCGNGDGDERASVLQELPRGSVRNGLRKPSSIE